MSIDAMNNDAAAGFLAGQLVGSAGAKVLAESKIPAVVIHEDFKVEFHPELLPKPLRKTGLVQLENLESFCTWFQRHGTDYSVILVTMDPTGGNPPEYTAVINYHGPMEGDMDHGDFRLTYSSRFSVEWQRWIERNRCALRHQEYLEHLEDCAPFILDPPGAELLELMKNIQGHARAEFSNALNLFNGKVKLAYEEDVEIRSQKTRQSGDMELPKVLTVGIAPFQFGQKYEIKNNCRYRVQDRQVTFAYEVQQVPAIMTKAVMDQMENITKLTGCQPQFGKIIKVA